NFARISSIGSHERRHAKKDRKLRQFKPLFVLAGGPFAAVEELAPLGLGSGIGRGFTPSVRILMQRHEHDAGEEYSWLRIHPISKSCQRPLIDGAHTGR